jgi:hypothetical protein
MAKFEEVSNETQQLFQRIIDSSFIPRDCRIKLLSNEGVKSEFGKVTKAQDIVKFMTNFDVVIQINEPIFDQLEDTQQEYIVKDLISQIHYDPDKDRVTINKPDITTFSGVLRQFDVDTYLGIQESIITLLEEKKIQEDLAKQK